MKVYIHGLHEPGGEHLMSDKPGWIVFTHELGADPNNFNSFDYRSWSDAGYHVLARLNYGYGPAGTIPDVEQYDQFALRVANFVEHSMGQVEAWIIGNEPNHPNEWPNGKRIFPVDYAQCFAFCRAEIHSRSGHGQDRVCAAPTAPWCNLVQYAGNGRGDWVTYTNDVLYTCRKLREPSDGIVLHTYTHGSDPALIQSMVSMDPPFTDRLFNFRAYQDYLSNLPGEDRTSPVYITETNQVDPWMDENQGWVQEAMYEIAQWNGVSGGTQQIHCLCLYRWPQYDKWFIVGKANVERDFSLAVAQGYYIDGEEPNPPNPPGGNMALQNPSFEMPYQEQSAPEVKVAEGWTAYYSEGEIIEGEGPTVRPEYKPVGIETDPQKPNRVIDGSYAQCWFVRWNIMRAGVYQTVDVPVGALLTFTIPVSAWCSQSDDPWADDGIFNFRLGIDAHGGTDPQAAVWGEWHWAKHAYHEMTIMQKALSLRCTFFVEAWNKYPLSHNDAYIDDATLIIEGGGGGWTEEQIREIAREEATDVFNTLLPHIRLTL